MHANMIIEQNTKEQTYFCLLTERELNEAECYDIRSVRNRLIIKDSMVPDFDCR